MRRLRLRHLLSMYYHKRREYARWAQMAGVMKDWKDGVPRGAYKGVVIVRRHGTRPVPLGLRQRLRCVLAPSGLLHSADPLPWPRAPALTARCAAYAAGAAPLPWARLCG